VSKLKRLLCYESQHQSQSNEKSLEQFDYEKAVSNYLGTQSTFKDKWTLSAEVFITTNSKRMIESGSPGFKPQTTVDALGGGICYY